MKIRHYHAPDMRRALSQVREAQGPDAVILSSRRVNGGVEVVAAVDYDEQGQSGYGRQATGYGQHEAASSYGQQAPDHGQEAAGYGRQEGRNEGDESRAPARARAQKPIAQETSFDSLLAQASGAMQ